MPVTVRVTPSCWTPRRWRKSAAGTIPAAASFTRSSPDGAVGGTSDRDGRGRAGLHRARFPAGGGAEGACLAASSRRDRQLPPAAGLGGLARSCVVASAGIAAGDNALVRATAALAGTDGHCASDAVRRGHCDQRRLGPCLYRLRLRRGVSGATSQPAAGGAQSCAGRAVVAVSCASCTRADARAAERGRGGAGLLPALPVVQPFLRVAARTFCLRATPC